MKAESLDGTRIAATNYRLRLMLVLAVGFLARLVLAPFGAYRGDMHQFRGWAAQLERAPLSSFYASRHLILDHLPGDLWILLGVEKLHKLLPSLSFVFLIKLVPAIADTGTAAVLYLVGKKLGGASAGLLAASLFAFNPAVLFLTSIWGQWDSLSAFLAVTATWLLLEERLAWALPALTGALLIKPPFAALILLFMLALIGMWMDGEKRLSRLSLLRGLVAGFVGSLVLATLVLLPFGVGAPPHFGRWSLIDRISYAWNYRAYTSTSAFNFWGLPFGNGRWRDTHHFLFNLTFESWGKGLTIAALGLILALYWRRQSDVMLVWAAFATTFSTFMLPTRQHERYLLPAVIFAALLAVALPRARIFYALITLTFFVNLYAIYVLENAAPHPSFPPGAPEFRYVVSLINVALLSYTFLLGIRAIQDGSSSALRSLSRADFAINESWRTSPAGQPEHEKW